MAKHPARCPKCKTRLEYESAVDGQIVCPGCKAVLAAPGKDRPADPLLGQTLGEFEILELIGRGGMGAVYKGRQPSLDRLVAVKVLPQRFAEDASFLERFHREARAAAAINHPNIIEVYAVGLDKGHEFIAMEFVDGDSLAGLLKREGRLAPDRALEIMRDVASALAEAHAKGIVHRDIKPANILLSARGRVKVADFGLAKRAGVDVSVTHTGASLGTPLYMAPEIARGELDNPSSDLYALGATFYQAIAGRPPFDGATPAELIVKHVNNPVPPLQQLAPDAPPGLCRVIHRLLYKNPAERYENADKLLEALSRVASRLTGAASAPRESGAVGGASVPRVSDVTRTLPGNMASPPAAVPHRRCVGGLSSRRLYLLAGIAAAILLVVLILVLRSRPSSQSAIRNPKSAIASPGTRTPTTDHRTPEPAAEQLESHAALCLEYAQTCAKRADWAKAKEYLGDLAGKYAATRFAAANKAAIAALRDQIEAGLKAAALKAPARTPHAEGWTPLFDGKSLAGWQVQRGEKFDQGKAQVDGDRILLFGGRPAAAIGWTGSFPDTGYEVEVEAMRTGRQNCFCAIGFPIGEGGATFVAGDVDGTAVGLDGVDGKDARENVTGRRKAFALNRWYRVRLRVAPDRVSAWIDEEQMVDLPTAGHTFTYRDPKFAFRVMAWAADAAVRAVRLRRLKAEAPPPDAEGRWGPWEELFDGKTLNGWSRRLNKDDPLIVEDGQICMRPSTELTGANYKKRDMGLAYTGDVPREAYEVAYEAMRVAGSHDFASLAFPVGEGECVLKVGTGKPGTGICLNGTDKDPAALSEAAFETGQWYRVRLRVAGGRIQAWIDEKQVIDFATAGHRFVGVKELKELTPLGLLCHATHASFRNIRLRRLRAEGAEAPKARAK